MFATRSKQAASATLEPPNLWTTQLSGAWEWEEPIVLELIWWSA
jgi:hypothetical protein